MNSKKNKPMGQKGLTKIIQRTPGYQFMVDQAVQASDRSGLRQGRGGRAQKALVNYVQQSTLYPMEQNWEGNVRWATVAGSNAAAQTGAAGSDASHQIGNAYAAMGQANANNALNQGQATADMYSNAAYAVGQGLSDYYKRNTTNLSEIDLNSLPQPRGYGNNFRPGWDG
jgi:hypothetical protein